MKRDNDLTFPVFAKEPLPPRLRSMDEIDQWIEEDFRLFFNREIYEKEKTRNSVKIVFRLEE